MKRKNSRITTAEDLTLQVSLLKDRLKRRIRPSILERVNKDLDRHSKDIGMKIQIVEGKPSNS